MQSDSQINRSSKQLDDIFDEQRDTNEESLGVRDVLLIRCKSVIQDLHQEISDLNHDNQQLEERINQLQQMLDEKDSQIRQSIYQNENIVDEFQVERAQVQMLQERNLEYEKELYEFKQNEDAIVQQLEELTITNNQMKQKIQELTQELEKRDHIAHEWNQTMQSVSQKIQELDKENQKLTSERNQIVMSLEKISPRNRFDQFRSSSNSYQDTNTRNQQQHNLLNEWLQQAVDNLQNAIRDNENKNQNIDQLQKENLNLKNSNMTLQRALEKNQHVFNSNQQAFNTNNNQNVLNNNNNNNSNQNGLNGNKNNNQNVQNNSQYNSNTPNQITSSFHYKPQESNTHYSQQDIETLQTQIKQLLHECEEKNQELLKSQTEIFQLKEKINHVNRKYLNAEIDSRQNDSTINNQVSSIEINKNNEISKYKELIHEQKELIRSLQNNDYLINQAKEMAKLQQTNEFLDQRLLECKEELNSLQKEVLNQFEKEDQKSHQTQQRLKQLELIIKERDLINKQENNKQEVIKCQNADIDQMKVIISQRASSSNRSRQQSRERRDSIKEDDEITQKQDIEKHDRTLLTLMNENKNQQALIDNLQIQLKNEKLVRIKEQNAIQRMKEEVEGLEDQYNREITFYKSEYTKQTTEVAAATSVQNTQSNQQLYIPTDTNINTENNEKEKKIIKLKKSQNNRSSTKLDAKIDSKTSLKPKTTTKKKGDKKKTEPSQSQSIIIPSLIMEQMAKENDNNKQMGEKVSSQQNIFQNAKLQQTPQQTQKVNLSNIIGIKPQQFEQEQNYQGGSHYNTVANSNQSTLRNQPQMGYYRTIQPSQQRQAVEQQQQQQQQLLQQPLRGNEEQIVNRFQHAITRIENKLDRMTIDLKLNDSEEDDDFKMSNYYKINS